MDLIRLVPTLDRKFIGGNEMKLSVKEILEHQGITPTPEHLDILEQRRAEMAELRGSLEGIALDDADIAVRNIPGGDHYE